MELAAIGVDINATADNRYGPAHPSPITITIARSSIMSHHTNHLSPQVSQVRHLNGLSAVRSAQRIDIKSASDADIAERAYEKFEARGRAHGFDREDWTAASRELIAETFGHLSSPSLSPSPHAS